MTQEARESATQAAQPGEHGNGEEQPRVVVRDRRRIDPETGEVRKVQEEVAADTGTQGGGRHAAAEPADAPNGQPADVADAGAPADEAPSGAHTAAEGAGGGADGADELRKQLNERTADLQRLTAEYANYRKRVERDRQLVIETAKGQIAGELLGVLDDVERANAHGDLTGAFKAVADKLVSALQRAGLEPFGHEGEEFDPSVHEAVQHSTSPDVSGPTVTLSLIQLVAVTDHEPGAPAAEAAAQAASDAPADAAEAQQQTTGSATDAPAGGKPADEQG